MRKNTVIGMLLGSLLGISIAGAAETPAAAASSATAIFAGGCFWCVESDFDKVNGVISTTSGYVGGSTKNPSYEAVSAGGTGHAEAVQVVFDPKIISYEKLLDVFWMNVDPFNATGQFCDNGDQYRSEIFYLNEEQKKLAEASKAELAKPGRFDKPIVTKIAAASEFYPAEEYHQDFHNKSAIRYNFYRYSCGRDKRLEEIWGKAK